MYRYIHNFIQTFQVLIAGAIKYNRVRKVRDFDGTVREVPDLLEVARTMIKAFRTGELGKIFLDIDLLNQRHKSHAEQKVDEAEVSVEGN